MFADEIEHTDLHHYGKIPERGKAKEFRVAIVASLWYPHLSYLSVFIHSLGCSCQEFRDLNRDY